MSSTQIMISIMLTHRINGSGSELERYSVKSLCDLGMSASEGKSESAHGGLIIGRYEISMGVIRTKQVFIY